MDCGDPFFQQRNFLLDANLKNKRFHKQALRAQRLNQHALAHACKSGNVELLQRCLDDTNVDLLPHSNSGIRVLIQLDNAELFTLVSQTERFNPFTSFLREGYQTSAFRVAVARQTPKALRLIMEHNKLTKEHLLTMFEYARDLKFMTSLDILVGSQQWKQLISLEENRQLFDQYAMRKNKGYVVLCLVKHHKLATSDELLHIAIENDHGALLDVAIEDQTIDLTESVQLGCQKNHMNLVERMIRTKRVDPTLFHNLVLRTAAMNGANSLIEVLLKDERIDPSFWKHDAWRVASEFGHADTALLILSQNSRSIPDTSTLIHKNVYTGVPSATILEYGRTKDEITDEEFKLMMNIRMGKTKDELSGKKAFINFKILKSLVQSDNYKCTTCGRCVAELIQYVKMKNRENQGKLFYICEMCGFGWVDRDKTQ